MCLVASPLSWCQRTKLLPYSAWHRAMRYTNAAIYELRNAKKTSFSLFIFQFVKVIRPKLLLGSWTSQHRNAFFSKKKSIYITFMFLCMSVFPSERVCVWLLVKMNESKSELRAHFNSTQRGAHTLKISLNFILSISCASTSLCYRKWIWANYFP